MLRHPVDKIKIQGVSCIFLLNQTMKFNNLYRYQFILFIFSIQQIVRIQLTFRDVVAQMSKEINPEFSKFLLSDKP